MRCDFSFGHYEQIVKLVQKRYSFSFFSDYAKKNNEKIAKVYLRHDVDLSLEKALELAKIEKKNGAVSTYFIRLDGLYYNIFHARYISIINKIVKLGHQIGLHFDELSVVSKEKNSKVFVSKIKQQISILRQYFPVNSVVSFHRPSPSLFGKDLLDEGLISTYSDYFFNKTKYLSDSRGLWKEGCVCKYLQNNNNKRDLQLLVHPVWWNRTSRDSGIILTRFLKEKLLQLDNEMGKEIQVYSKKF